jgi:hypothetical protein
MMPAIMLFGALADINTEGFTVSMLFAIQMSAARMSQSLL